MPSGTGIACRLPMPGGRPPGARPCPQASVSLATSPFRAAAPVARAPVGAGAEASAGRAGRSARPGRAGNPSGSACRESPKCRRYRRYPKCRSGPGHPGCPGRPPPVPAPGSPEPGRGRRPPILQPFRRTATARGATPTPPPRREDVHPEDRPAPARPDGPDAEADRAAAQGRREQLAGIQQDHDAGADVGEEQPGREHDHDSGERGVGEHGEQRQQRGLPAHAENHAGPPPPRLHQPGAYDRRHRLRREAHDDRAEGDERHRRPLFDGRTLRGGQRRRPCRIPPAARAARHAMSATAPHAAACGGARPLAPHVQDAERFT